MSARFGCPACGRSDRIGQMRARIECVDVAAWNPDGTPASYGMIVRTEPADLPRGEYEYECGWCARNFHASELRRLS